MLATVSQLTVISSDLQRQISRDHAAFLFAKSKLLEYR